MKQVIANKENLKKVAGGYSENQTSLVEDKKHQNSLSIEFFFGRRTG